MRFMDFEYLRVSFGSSQTERARMTKPQSGPFGVAKIVGVA